MASRDQQTGRWEAALDQRKAQRIVSPVHPQPILQVRAGATSPSYGLPLPPSTAVSYSGSFPEQTFHAGPPFGTHAPVHAGFPVTIENPAAGSIFPPPPRPQQWEGGQMYVQQPGWAPESSHAAQARAVSGGMGVPYSRGPPPPQSAPLTSTRNPRGQRRPSAVMTPEELAKQRRREQNRLAQHNLRLRNFEKMERLERQVEDLTRRLEGQTRATEAAESLVKALRQEAAQYRQMLGLPEQAPPPPAETTASPPLVGATPRDARSARGPANGGPVTAELPSDHTVTASTNATFTSVGTELHTSPLYQHAQLLAQQYPSGPSPLRVRSIHEKAQVTYSEPLSSASSSGYGTAASVQYRRASDPEPPQSMSSASTLSTNAATRSMSDLSTTGKSPRMSHAWPDNQTFYGFPPAPEVVARGHLPLPQPPFSIPPCGIQGCEQRGPHGHEWQ